MPDKISPSQFAEKIKAKYPEYNSYEDSKLVDAILKKYPEYGEQIDFNLSKPLPSRAPMASTGLPTFQEQQATLQQVQSKYDKAVQDDRNKAGKLAATVYNGLVGSLESLAGFGAEAFSELAQRIPTPATDFGGNKLVGGGIYELTPEEQKQARVELKKSVKAGGDVLRSGYVTREEEKQLQGKFDITNGLGLDDFAGLTAMSGRIAGDLGLGALTGGTSFVMQGYSDAVDDYDEAAKSMGLPENTNARALYGIAGGTINGLLEKYAIDKLVGDGPVFRAIQKKAIANVLKNTSTMTGKAAIDGIEKFAKEEVKQLTSNLKSKGLRAGYRALVEGGTEGLQAALEDGAKFASNWAQGQEVFNEQEIKDSFAKNIFNSAAAGAVFGPVIGFGIDKKFGRNINTEVLNDIANARTPEELEKINQDLEEVFNKNNFSEEERKIVMDNARRYAEVKQTLPADTPADVQKLAIPKIESRIKLDDEIQAKKAELETVDESVKPSYEQDIALLQDKRAQINDQIREAITGQNFQYTEENGKFFKQFPDGQKEEISKNRYDLEQIKLEDDATTKGQGPIQEGGTAGDISQRAGTQERGAQKAPTKTDSRYRNISSEEAVGIPKFLGSTVVYKLPNRKITGTLIQEGQTLSVEDENGDVVAELGNIDELSNMSPEQMNLTVIEPNVETTEKGFTVDGKELLNENENPFDAVSVDKNDNVMNVVLTTAGGKRRKFRGRVAQKLADQISQKEDQRLQQEFALPTPKAPKVITTQPAIAKVTEDNIGELDAVQGTKLQKKVLNDVKNVVNAIGAAVRNATGFPVSVNVHNKQSFRDAVIEAGGTEENASSRGFYMGSDGSIHLNMDAIASDTMLHEGFHPMLDALTKYNPSVVNDLFAQLESIPEAAPIIEKARRSYKGDILQKEEAITDFVAGVADGRIVLNPSNFERIKNFILDMLNKIGIGGGGSKLMNVKNEQDLVKLAKFVTEKFTTGEAITLQELDKVVGAKSGYQDKNGNDIPEENIKFSVNNDFSDVKTKTTFSYLKNDKKFEKLKSDGFITETKRLDDFVGKKMMLHSPDNAFTGIILKNGEILIEGKGGVFYPIRFHEDGYFWASTSTAAKSMANRLNQMLKDNDGKIYMALVSSPSDKLLSSTTAANGVMEFFASTALDKAMGLSQQSVSDALVKAASSKALKKIKKKDKDDNDIIGPDGKPVYVTKTVGLNMKVPKSKIVDGIRSNTSLKEIKDIISGKLSADNSTFEDRKLFSMSLIKNIINVVKGTKSEQVLGQFFDKGILNTSFKQQGKIEKKYNLSSANVRQSISEMLSEPMLKGSSSGQVYAVLEIEGNVKPVESDKHESYPMAIASDANKNTVLHILQEREDWSDRFADPETGSKVEKDRMLNVFPTSGVSNEALVLLPKQQGPKFQKVEAEDIVNGFYSPIVKRIDEFKQPKASVQKWKEIVGIKSDEAVFSGLSNWLSTMKPDSQLSKEEVRKFMKDNSIEIKELIGSEEEDSLPDSDMRGSITALQIPGGKNYKEILITLPEKYEYPEIDFTIENRNNLLLDKKNYSVSEETDRYFVVNGPRGSSMPIYKEYNIKTAEDAINAAVEDNDYVKYSENITWDFIDKNGKYFHSEYAPTKEDAIRQYMDWNKREKYQFRSSHFDEPNIITHLRMNTRTDEDGKKVLFLEEVQSDWGQKGKREGFMGNVKVSDIEILSETPTWYDRENGAMRYEVKIKVKGFDEIDSGVYYPDLESIEQYKERIVKGYNEFVGIPSAPYVTNTNAWVKLGLKVALKEAVKQGADRIAWTTGKQQNARYDLRKQVDSIIWEKDADGTYAVTAEKDGRTISSQQGLTPNKLEEAIGKDAAEKIVNSNSDNGVLEGNDLAVGGKGMNAFYGDAKNPGIVANVAKALVKELTGKEGAIIASEIKYYGGGSNPINFIEEFSSYNEQEYEFLSGSFSQGFKNVSKDEAIIKFNEGKKVYAVKNNSIQPAIDITPELSNSVQEGMPKFQKSPTKTVKQPVKRFLKDQFIVGGILGKEVMALKEEMGGELSDEMTKAENISKKASALIKKYSSVVTSKDIEDFLTSKPNANRQIPMDLAATLAEMRAHVDNLTERLINLGVVDDPDEVAKYRENKGKYLLRSYEIFNAQPTAMEKLLLGKSKTRIDIDNVKKKLKNVDQAKVDNALRFLEREISKGDPTLTPEQVKEQAIIEANKILSDTESKFAPKKYIGSTNVKSLEERLDIAPEIRALMGEYTDPIYNYYASIFKLAALTSNRKFLNDMKEQGMGKFLFKDATKDASVQIASEGSEALKPLAGLYTFPEIKEALEKQEKLQASIISKMLGRFRMLKTVYNPGTHVKNIIGNAGFFISNGHWTYMDKVWDLMRSSPKEREELMSILRQQGVLNSSVGLGELNSYFDRYDNVEDFLAAIQKQANDKSVKGWTKEQVNTVKRTAKDVNTAIKKAYQLEDDVFKIMAFVNESNRYANALFSKEYSKLNNDEKAEINKIASENVKNTYPTFSRAPKFVKGLSKYLLLGNFLTFPVESVRISYNTLKLAKDEINSGNPKLKAIGMTRMAGTLAYNALFSTLMYYTSMAGVGLGGMLGAMFDDEEEKEARKAINLLREPFTNNSDIIPTKFSNGQLVYTDIGSLDSYSYQKKVWNAFWDNINDEEGFKKAIYASTKQLVDPYMTFDFTFQAFKDLYDNNEEATGRQVYNPEAKYDDKVVDVGKFLVRKFGPGIINSAMKSYAFYEEGDAEKLKNEIISQGVRTYTIDTERRFARNIYAQRSEGNKMVDVGFKERLDDAERIYMDVKNNKAASQQEKDAAYAEAVEAYKNILNDVSRYYQATLRSGVPNEKLLVLLAKARLGDQRGRPEIYSIMKGVADLPDQTYIRK
jgi:hypothetical protein